MKRIALSVFALAMMAQSASADTSGPRALALAALVATHSPLLSGQDKHAIARLFDGHLGFPFPAGRKITVQADAILCRASNVDITSRSCTLTFGTHTAMLKRAKRTNCSPPSRKPACPRTARPAASSRACRISTARSIQRKSSKRPAAARTASSIPAPRIDGAKVTLELRVLRSEQGQWRMRRWPQVLLPLRTCGAGGGQHVRATFAFYNLWIIS